MMWSDKAFQIYMGHSGEDSRVYVQDDAPVSARSYDDTQVLALARHEITSVEFGRRPAGHGGDGEPERIAA